MHSLYNRAGEVIAYLHQNAIIHPDTLEVHGVVLGNCVFGPHAKLLGKFCHDKLYNTSGEMLAKKEQVSMSLPLSFNYTNSIAQSWKILTRIKDHVCPWVPEKDVWSRASFAEYLYV